MVPLPRANWFSEPDPSNSASNSRSEKALTSEVDSIIVNISFRTMEYKWFHRWRLSWQNWKSQGRHCLFLRLCAGEFVLVSGQASVDFAGRIVTDSFEGEMRRSIANVSAILASVGMNLNDVIQVRSYLGREEDVAEYNRIYREYFKDPLPARTTLAGVLGKAPEVRTGCDGVSRRPGRDLISRTNHCRKSHARRNHSSQPRIKYLPAEGNNVG